MCLLLSIYLFASGSVLCIVWSGFLSCVYRVDMPCDNEDRMKEAVVRLLVSALKRQATGEKMQLLEEGMKSDVMEAATLEEGDWLNPTEVLWSHQDNVSALVGVFSTLDGRAKCV